MVDGCWRGAAPLKGCPTYDGGDPESLHCDGFDGGRRQAELAADALVDRLEDLRVVLEELLDVFAALTEALAVIGEPRAALFDDALVDREVEQVPGLRNAFAVHDVELGLAEGRRDLVLDHLHARAAADHDVAVLDRGDAADVHPNRRVELQRAAAGCRFGVAEHDADLLAQLVDENERALRLRDGTGQLAQRLRHQPRLQAHLRFAHLAFDFRLGDQRRDRVDDDDVDAVRADQDLDDFERLFAVVGLRHEQVVDVDPELLRVRGVERMLGVDERRHAAQFLRFGDDLQRERGFAGGFRPEDLDDAAARHAADAKRVIDADGAGRDGVNWLDGALAPQTHDRPFTELLFDLADGDIHRLAALALLSFVSFNSHVMRSSEARPF